MIVFDLHCPNGHRFEGWFGSSSDYEDQLERGLVSCPQCGSEQVGKAPMAPAVAAKGNRKSEQLPDVPMPSTPAAPLPAAVAKADESKAVANAPMPAEVKEALTKLADAQQKALKDSTWVGKDFATQSREMHYGEREQNAIHGQASLEEAKELVEEGVPVAPLPFPITPPDELN